MSELLGGLESARVMGESQAAMPPRYTMDDESSHNAVYLYRLDRQALALKAFLRACEVVCSDPGLARALAILAGALLRQATECPRFIAR